MMMDVRRAGGAADDLAESLVLLSVDPALQGAYVFGPADAATDSCIRRFERWLAGGEPVRLPVRATPGDLEGELDVEATLAAGRPVWLAGLVERASGGLIAVDSADRLARATAAALTGKLSQLPLPRRPLLLVRAHAPPAPQDPLASHCALWLAAPSARAALSLDEATAPHPPAWDWNRIRAARRLLARVRLAEPLMRRICRAIDALGCTSQPLDWFVARAASALAAWHDREHVRQDDVDAALALVAAPRGATARAHPESVSPWPAAGGTTPFQASPAASLSPAAGTTDQAAGEGPVGRSAAPEPAEAAWDGSSGPARVTVVPPAALGRALALPLSARKPSPSRAAQSLRGRPGPRAGRAPDGPLSLAATLRAAAPYQRLRAPRPPLVVPILPDDLRFRRRRPRARSVFVLAVDGSGSMGQGRMHLAKAAALSVLHGAYRERRFVALIDFRGRQARVLCPPGRSSTAIRRHIVALPSGGGTPLAAGLAAALETARTWQRRHPDATAAVVLFTDGKANVPLQRNIAAGGAGAGSASAQSRRSAAWHDVERVAGRLRASDIFTVLVDSGPGTPRELQRLATLLGGEIVRVVTPVP
ncbi:MAG: VWA domain-containing protein [Firmicutes bacterium]|nr:VWA domain-containing protein [Bacillota bacterium]